MKLINSSEDGLNKSFSIIGEAFVCSERYIAINCAKLSNITLFSIKFT